METVVLDTNGVRLHCLAWGAEDAPLAVLVHGFPDTPYTWDLVGPRVAEAGYRVLAPFTRGIGPSTDTDPPDYGSDTLGADLIGLIDALGREQAVLVGHDFGASAVYSATGNHPGRVAKMVTVAIPHPATLKVTLGKAWGVRHFLTHRLPGAASRFARDDFAQVRVLYERWSPTFDWPDSELDAVKQAYSDPASCAAALGYYRFITATVPPGQRARIPVPSLIIGGTTDGVADAVDFERSKARFTGTVEVAMVPGGHFLHREHPESFLEVLLPFLAS